MWLKKKEMTVYVSHFYYLVVRDLFFLSVVPLDLVGAVVGPLIVPVLEVPGVPFFTSRRLSCNSLQ